ncbi:MAG: hypothetical protein A2176_00645 [Spirochaetes bacterium RBG_13_51_14]|nr:MAG: hypothetical protein A2176_00645 [Spirochaetes bacterium RBG_13_51_14]
MKSITVLSTGNELLSGATADTNSGSISRALFPLEISTRMILVVGDDMDDMERALRYGIDTSDVLIVTGGLGPTDDDNTIAALQKIFGFSIRTDGESRDRMEKFFNTLGMSLSAADIKMVEVPAGVRVIPNGTGLAPGFIIQNDKNIIIALPGVPAEMNEMMELSVIPFLTDEYGIQLRRNIAFRVIGMKESEINSAVASMEIPHDRLAWGITARDGIATVTFSEKQTRAADLDSIVSQGRKLFGERFLEPAYGRPEEEAVVLLREKRKSVSFAESCTGGLVSKRITDIPGSSDVFVGGVVAYSDEVKVRLLGVSKETLTRHGAVSEETAAEMAAGVRGVLAADIGISITGIAGPGGGSDAKPIGTVCFGSADATGVKTFSRSISGNRDRVRTIASLIAIEYLRTVMR